jgi:NADH:ubiquinone oxidoreductase subunit 6 (subunit J)
MSHIFINLNIGKKLFWVSGFFTLIGGLLVVGEKNPLKSMYYFFGIVIA